MIRSLSARRAWIEICLCAERKPPLTVALRKESVDRNCVNAADRAGNNGSLSARRAWIEMQLPSPGCVWMLVALRKESVDRNCNSATQARPLVVALRKESVDRNAAVPAPVAPGKMSLSARRAWIEIFDNGDAVLCYLPSLSARRAWIEIAYVVAEQYHHQSLSARRAWIEITR